MPRVDLEPEATELTFEQVGAFCTLSELVGRKPIVKLTGYAGSGKTYLAGSIARWAARMGKVSLAAPTHKSASVLRGKVAGLEVRTIHSLLGLILKPDLRSDEGGHILVDNGAKDKVSEGLVICDEASMIGKVLTQHVEASAERGVRWLFVGDPAQLPPVGEAPSRMLDHPDVCLHNIVRQARGSEIINLATRVRSGDYSLRHAGREVRTLRDRGELFEAAYERFASQEYADDASFARVLTYRNALRQEFNERMREALFGDSEPYMPGEWLVMYAPWWQDRDDPDSLRLHVSQEVRVVHVDRREVPCQRWVFSTWMVTVETEDGLNFVLPVVAEESKTKFTNAKNYWAEQAKEAARKCREHVRVRCWELFHELRESFAEVDYAYAMTVHKAQGSTFDHALVDVRDLMTATSMQQELLYTAVTRPSHTLTMVR